MFTVLKEHKESSVSLHGELRVDLDVLTACVHLWRKPFVFLGRSNLLLENMLVLHARYRNARLRLMQNVSAFTPHQLNGHKAFEKLRRNTVRP